VPPASGEAAVLRLGGVPVRKAWWDGGVLEREDWVPW